MIILSKRLIVQLFSERSTRKQLRKLRGDLDLDSDFHYCECNTISKEGSSLKYFENSRVVGLDKKTLSFGRVIISFSIVNKSQQVKASNKRVQYSKNIN